MLSRVVARLSRKKQVTETDSHGSGLSRCLTTLDLTLLGAWCYTGASTD